MRYKRFYTTQLMKLCFQALLYLLLFASFFGLLSISNPAMLSLSRTAATTIATFVVVMVILTAIFSGYDIGVKKKRTVLSGLSLTVLFTDVITYVQLQIMNVNPQNPEANARLVLGGEDLALLGCALALQLLVIVLLVNAGYALYYRINPPQDCLIVTSSQELAEHVAEKLAAFRQLYKLSEVVHYECPDVKKTILEHSVVFLTRDLVSEEALLETYCYKHNKSIYLLAEMEDVIISTAQQSVLDDTPFLYIGHAEPTVVQLFIKRAADIAFSVLGIVITSPVMLIIALVLKCSHNGSVLFRQERATLNGRVFEILKFRTMYPGKPRLRKQPIRPQG